MVEKDVFGLWLLKVVMRREVGNEASCHGHGNGNGVTAVVKGLDWTSFRPPLSHTPSFRRHLPAVMKSSPILKVCPLDLGTLALNASRLHLRPST